MDIHLVKHIVGYYDLGVVCLNLEQLLELVVQHFNLEDVECT